MRDDARSWWKQFGAEFDGNNVNAVIRLSGTRVEGGADSRGNSAREGDSRGLSRVDGGAGRSEKTVANEVLGDAIYNEDYNEHWQETTQEVLDETQCRQIFPAHRLA